MKPAYFLTSVSITSKDKVLERNRKREAIGAVNREDPEYELGRVDSRTWGFVHELCLAQDMACGNHIDMHEDSFQWLCIEEIMPGLLRTYPDNVWYYEWSEDTGAWMLLDEPPQELVDIYEREKVVFKMATIG